MEASALLLVLLHADGRFEAVETAELSFARYLFHLTQVVLLAGSPEEIAAPSNQGFSLLFVTQVCNFRFLLEFQRLDVQTAAPKCIFIHLC